MNVMLTAKGAVHATTRAGLPACNTGRTGKPMQSTERAVTCKRCLKVLADREDAAARVAYYASLRDGQDETLGQAPPAAEVIEAETVETVGRKVLCRGGSYVPGFAVLAEVTTLAKIRGTRQGTVTIAEDDDPDFGLTVWVYAQYDGDSAVMVYMGDSRADATAARDAFVAGHDEQTELMSHSMAGVRVETATKSVTKVYRAEDAAPARPVCCVCGTAPDYKLYENYRGQLFCVPCADGKQADTIEPMEAPAASEPPAGVVTVVVDGITWWTKLAEDPAGNAFVWYATPTTVQWFQCNRQSPAGSVTRAIWDAVQAARNA